MSPATTTLDRRQQVWRWRIFGATWLSYAGFYFCRKPFYITKSALGDNLHFSASTLGDIGAVYLIAYTVGQFVAGKLGNRTGPRVLLLTGMALSLACNLVFGFTNSAQTFLVMMAVNGLVQATGWSGNVGTMANWFRRSERGTVMGFWATNFQVGGVAANMLASWVLGAYGFRYSYFTGAAVLLVVWCVFLFNQRNSPKDLGLEPIAETEPNGAASPGEAEADHRWTRPMVTNVVLVGAFYFFVKFIRYALWSWVPFFLSRNFHQQGSTPGYLSTLFDLFGIAGVIVTGLLSDRVFKSRRAGIGLIMILLMLASTLLLYWLGRFSVPVFAVCLACVGFTLYGPDALLSGAGAMDIGSRRGATLAAGIINGMGSAGAVLQELVISRSYEADSSNLGPIFMMIVGASMMAALFLGIVNLRNRLGRSNV